MEDEEDDEEEEHATERRSFASVSTGSACGESSWSSLAWRHVVTLSDSFRLAWTTQSSSWDSALESMVRATIRS